jgi:hypothetical protein
VFVDAGLPHGGVRRIDALPEAVAGQLRSLRREDGTLPPWRAWFPGVDLPVELPAEEERPLPWSLLTEELPVEPGWPDAPCGYVLLSDAYDGELAAAREAGWPVAEVPGHHLSLLTEPDMVMAGIMLVAAAGGVATV